MISRWTRLRILVAGGMLGVLALFVVKRAAELVFRPVEIPDVGKRWLKDLAEANHIKEIELPPQRGRVLDRNGLELATTAEFDSVFCNPRQLVHVPDGPKKIAKALGMTEREVREKLKGKEQKYFALIARWVTPEQAAAIKALGLPGVGTRKEPKRVYPHGQLAATVVGLANRDGQGIEGVEAAYNALLRGSGSKIKGIKDAGGRDLLINGVADPAATAGRDLVLSLDNVLTYTTEKALAEVVKKTGAKSAMSITMDPRTGEILAMASVPTFDPNDPKDSIERGAKNRIITDTYEPGSTMKTFTFAAALEDPKFDPWKSWWDCEMGRFRVGRHTIGDSHPKGVLTGAAVFAHSSNIGTVKIARQHVGKERLYEAYRRFGFGQRAGLGLAGEQPGLLYPPRKWGEIHFANIAFGQGLTVTPLQMATAYTAIASGGLYRPPRLAIKVVHPNGKTEALPPSGKARPEERIMSEKNARSMLQLMRAVTEPGGTATRAAIPGYQVGGKTGTAQKVVNGKYGAYIASFFGVVPINDPRLVIAVIVDEPRPPEHQGGMVAAPVFRQIAEEALRYLAIPPTEPIVAKQEDRAGASAEGATTQAKVKLETLEGLGFQVPAWEIVEESAEGARSGEDGEALAAEEAPEVVVPETVDVPNFAGMSLGEAVRAAARLGLELEPEGSGVAFSQIPLPGPVVRGATCRVSFRPPGG